MICGDVAARFDQLARQDRQRGKALVHRRSACADRIDIGRRHVLLERQHRMERDCPGAGICDRVGQQQGLDLRLCECAGVDLLKQPDESLDQLRRVSHGAGDVRDQTESLLQLLEHRLRFFPGPRQ